MIGDLKASNPEKSPELMILLERVRVHLIGMHLHYVDIDFSTMNWGHGVDVVILRLVSELANVENEVAESDIDGTPHKTVGKEMNRTVSPTRNDDQ